MFKRWPAGLAYWRARRYGGSKCQFGGMLPAVSGDELEWSVFKD